ncbi:MAG: hypothetical protein CME68_03945 [Halobacteriovoraceae bacterium]|nr:hypothetical protein [Halobacteriovoraceae bacterium]
MAEEEKKGKVLICDDSDDLRIFMALKLSRAGYEVIQASNGKECINILQEDGEINVLILDIMMPEMNGIQTLHQLKLKLKKVKNKQAQEIEKHKEEKSKKNAISKSFNDDINLKILFCSSYDDQTKIDLALQGGGDDYIVKPIDDKILLQKIERLMGQSSGSRFHSVPSTLMVTLQEFKNKGPLKLSSLSEIGAFLEVPFKISDGETVTILSETLTEIYKVNFNLKGVVVFSEQISKDTFKSEMTFKGFNEIQREKIRSITLKNRELKEPSDEEEEEDGA